MARINIEECWWSDSRRNKLIELLQGNSRLADGLMLQVWKLAQNHCANENGYIPLSQFLCLTDAEMLFECDLVVLIQANAKQTPSKAKQMIVEAKQDEAKLSKCQAYVRGTKQHHDWLVKRRNAGTKGGVKSALRPRDEEGKLQANTKQSQANDSKGKQTQPSSSSSCSSSSSNSYSSSLFLSGSKSKKKNAGIRLDYPQDFDALWLAYDRKGDKKESYVQYQAMGLSPDEHSVLETAIKNYCKAKPDIQYRKDFENFLKMDWRELAKHPLPNGHAGSNPFLQVLIENDGKQNGPVGN